jgi:hypothetical protein
VDKRAIETMAVAAVQRHIARCDLVEPWVNEKDKEPCWDGFLYIYKTKRKTKEPSINRVAVQVKGTEKKDLSQEEINVRVALSDLRSFLNIFGTIYFVVYINGLDSRIYYLDFTPVRIKSVLEKAKKNQKTIGLKFKSFPNDIKEIENIVIDFADHCKRQASFADIRLDTIDELMKKESSLCLSMFFTGRAWEEAFETALKYGTYLYKESESSPIPQPIGTIPLDVSLTENITAPIIINGKQYYDNYKRVKSTKSTEFVIGESITIKVDNRNRERITIKYKPSDKLRMLAKDLEFMLDFLEASSIKLDEASITYSITSEQKEIYDAKKQRGNLIFYQKAVQALDNLNCSGDISLSSLSKAQFHDLHNLVTAIIDKKPVSGLSPNLPLAGSIVIGEYKFALVFEPYKKKAGTYIISDLFVKNLDVYITDSDGNQHPISQYCILVADDFLTITNMRLDVVLSSFTDVPYHPFVSLYGNKVLLEMLLAFDKSDNRTEILKTATELAEWLLHKTADDVLPISIRQLNLYQTYLRSRELKSVEKDDIQHIINSSSEHLEVRAGAYLLLNQQADAEAIFEAMDEETENAFMKYPISRFREKKKDKMK